MDKVFLVLFFSDEDGMEYCKKFDYLFEGKR